MDGRGSGSFLAWKSFGNPALISSLLPEQGTPITAHSGLEALAKIWQRKPDLTILDPALPSIDGFEIARKMASDIQLCDVPVAFCSYLKDHTTINEALSHKNVVRYFVKPLLGNQLKEPNRAFLFPPPIKGFSVAYRQQFSNFGQVFWLPVGLQFQAELDIGFIGLQFPPIKLDQISRLSNYEVKGTAGLPLPETAKGDGGFGGGGAGQPGCTGRGGGAAVGKRDGSLRDHRSNMTMEKAYKPTGFLARFIDDDEEEKEKRKRRRQKRGGGDGKEEKGKVSFEFTVNFLPQIWYNRVDAAHLGLKVKWGGHKDQIAFEGAGAYNTGIERWKFSGVLTLR